MNFDELSSLARHVHEARSRVAFADENGDYTAVLIDAEELDRLERRLETLEVLANPELREELEEAESDIAAGRTHSTDEILADLAVRQTSEGHAA